MNTGGLTTCSGALLGCDNRQGVVLIWDCYRALQLLPLRVEEQWQCVTEAFGRCPCACSKPQCDRATQGCALAELDEHRATPQPSPCPPISLGFTSLDGGQSSEKVLAGLSG